MDIRTYYEWTKKKPLTEKVDRLILEVEHMKDYERKADESQNPDTREYYKSESRHMSERVRLLRWYLLSEMQE